MKKGTISSIFQKYWWVLYGMGVVAIALKYAVLRIYSVDFSPTNGDFQIYNTLRRTLAAQVPYRDFANYLGSGSLLLHLPFLLFHNSLAGSMFTTHFVSSILFTAMVFIIFYVVTDNKWFAMLGSLVFPQLINGKFLEIIPGLGYYLWYTTDLLLKPNYSLRMVRMFLPFLYAIFFLLYTRAYKKKRGKEFDLCAQIPNKRFCLVLGFLVGFGMTWSNDFGFACIGALSILFLVFLVRTFGKQYKKMGVPLLCYFVCLLLGMFVSVMLSSAGDLSAYLKFTIGVAEYQYWYFGIYESDKIQSVANYFSTKGLPLQTLYFVLGMAWCIYRLIKNKLNNRNLVFGFLYLCIFLGTMVYIYGAGGYNFYEGMNSFVIFTAFGLLARGALWGVERIKTKKDLLKACSVVMAGAVCAYTCFAVFSSALSIRSYNNAGFAARPNYMPVLEGELPKADELRAQLELVGEEPVFSTYATALEALRGEFQPTGIDYIIHVLGDAQKEGYLEEFVNGNYKYVQTINFELTIWEAWISRVNWDFYRILYAEYDIALKTENWMIWERKADGVSNRINPDVALQVNQIDATSTEILVSTAYTQDCIVDVLIDYDSDYVFNLYRLQTWKRSVCVLDESLYNQSYMHYKNYFAPLAATQRHFQVFVSGGFGRIVLSSLPRECTQLRVTNVTVGEVCIWPQASAVALQSETVR